MILSAVLLLSLLKAPTARTSGTVHALLLQVDAGPVNPDLTQMSKVMKSAGPADVSTIYVSDSSRASSIVKDFRGFASRVSKGDIAFVHVVGTSKRVKDLTGGNPDGFRVILPLAVNRNGDAEVLGAQEFADLCKEIAYRGPKEIVLSFDCDYAEGLAVDSQPATLIQLFATGADESLDAEAPEVLGGVLPSYTAALAKALGDTSDGTYRQVIQRVQSLRSLEMVLHRDEARAIGRLDLPVQGIASAEMNPSSREVLRPMEVDGSKLSDDDFDHAVKAEVAGRELFSTPAAHSTDNSLFLDYPRDHEGVPIRTSRINLKLREAGTEAGSILAGFEAGTPVETPIDDLLNVVAVQATDNPAEPGGEGVQVRVVPQGSQPADGSSTVPSVAKGGQFSVEVRSTGSWKPYVCVFAINPYGHASLISSADKGTELRVDKTWQSIGQASDGSPALFPASVRGWTIFKALATDKPIDPNGILSTCREDSGAAPYFRFTRSRDGGVELDNNHAGWATADASLRTTDPHLAPDGQVYSINIGINKYPNLPISPGSYSDKDAKALANEFPQSPNHKSVTLVNEQATRAAIIKSILDASSKLGPSDTFILTFSGSGELLATKGSAPVGLIFPYDAKNDSNTVITLAELKAGLNSIPCRNQVVMLDCFYQDDIDQVLAKELVPEGGDISDVVGADGNRLYLIDETSQESPKVHHGFLTASVLNAIRDPKSDEDGDGAISSSELAKAVSRQYKDSNRHQRYPQIIVGRQTGTAFPLRILAGSKFGIDDAVAVQDRGHGPYVSVETRQQDRSGAATRPTTPSDVSGRDYAFIIATDKYVGGFQNLLTPVQEANTLKTEMEDTYIVAPIQDNKTKEDIYTEWYDQYLKPDSGLRSDQDNQLILYIAGHGAYVKNNPLLNGGWILLTDDPADHPYKWSLSFKELVEWLTDGTRSPFKNICIIADVCYGGQLGSGVLEPNTSVSLGISAPDPSSTTYYRDFFQGQSVTAIASGMFLVKDGTADAGTNFSKAIDGWFKAIKALTAPMTADDLYSSIHNLTPTPVEKFIGNGGGRFVFFPHDMALSRCASAARISGNIVDSSRSTRSLAKPPR